MSDDEASLSMSMPLDSEGFLRRECPTCEREFKWLPAEEDSEGTPSEDGGYYCPYCGVQAGTDTWLTQAQVQLAHNLIAREVLGPMVENLGREIGNVGRDSGGLTSASMRYEAPDEMDPLTEVDDMRRVDFECHPSEPLKVLDDWSKPVRCLICGQPAP